MPENIFDKIRDAAFDVTTTTFGYSGAWTPAATPEIDALTARVHFKDPNSKETMGGVDFMPLSPFMEYRAPFFPGLYESVRDGVGEVVTISGIQYDVRSVEKLADGKTFKAYLEPIPIP